MTRFNRRRKGRDISGILLLDKPIGISSNQALQRVKDLYHAAKAGHTGSLDPLASGLLPICMGEATKISAFLLNADKSYFAQCQLGERTSTGDREGQIVEKKPVPKLSVEQVNEVLKEFIGEITQIPPMHSAIKVNGIPLYKLAHQGIEIERSPRQVTIHSLSLENLSADQMELAVSCSKGTYIRTLVEDIGHVLTCGAHILNMRRLKVGSFEIDASYSLPQLQEIYAQDPQVLDQYLVPMESALTHWPAIQLSPDTGFYMRQGQAVFIPHAPKPGWVRLYTQEGTQFIGLGEVLEDGRLAPKRLLSHV